MDINAPQGEPWAGLWSWAKGKQGDWLVRGPWKCCYCEGTGIYVFHGASPHESKCSFCAGSGDIQPPYNVTVISKAGKLTKVVLRLRLWKHATDNVALWSVYDSKPVAKKYPSKQQEQKPDVQLKEWVAAHNAKLAKEILEHPVTKAAQAAIKASKEPYDDPAKWLPPAASTDDIFSSDPVEEEESSEPTIDVSHAPLACSNCGKVDKNLGGHEAFSPARDCDGLRGICCPKCLTLSANERDFG